MVQGFKLTKASGLLLVLGVMWTPAQHAPFDEQNLDPELPGQVPVPGLVRQSQEGGGEQLPTSEEPPTLSGPVELAQEPDVPLLFHQNVQHRKCKLCRCQRRGQSKPRPAGSRLSVGHMAMTYAMYVISIPDLLELDQLYPHQVMIEKGLVHEWTEAHGLRDILWTLNLIPGARFLGH